MYREVPICRYLSFFYANSEPQPNAKYLYAASVAIARYNSHSVFYLVA